MIVVDVFAYENQGDVDGTGIYLLTLCSAKSRPKVDCAFYTGVLGTRRGSLLRLFSNIWVWTSSVYLSRYLCPRCQRQPNA